MTKCPYSQFITTRHYQLIIRDLYRQPTKVLPRVFNLVVLGSDIPTIQEYADYILGIKPDETIIPPDIFNNNSLFATAKSGCIDKFKWMFENYQFISLIYSKQDDKDSTIFNNPESLQYFIIGVIREHECSKEKNHRVAKVAGINQILDWLLFSQNTREGKSLQEWSINLGYYNTRDKMDYKEIYSSCISCNNLNLAQQILSTGLIPPGDIQTGRDIIQPSFRAGMIAGNQEFLDFIILVDARNGEWLSQGRENNFSELALIIRGWADKSLKINEIISNESKCELLSWYLARYFQKYFKPSYTNEELGLLYDFTIEIVGLVPPIIWRVITNHFSAMTGTKKYKLLAKRRLVAALGQSNLPMSKLLLAELLAETGETDSSDWVVNIPTETLIDICSGRYPKRDIAMLEWLWQSRDNFMIDWQCIIRSARSWIAKYYSPNLPSPLPIINWIWTTICQDAGICYSRTEFAESLSNEDCWQYINKDVIKITELCIKQNPQLVPKIWQHAVKYHRAEVCEFLLSKYPEMKYNLIIPKEDYFRGLFNYIDFSCWALEAFPHELARMTVDMAYELITQQFGRYYNPHSKELAKLLGLFPFSGDVSAHGNYLFHYTQRMISEAKNEQDKELCRQEWLKVLYKICLMDQEKYSVILDPENPKDITRAQFELLEQYSAQEVNCVEQCPICQACPATRITSCRHQFCGGCITQWFNQQKEQTHQKTCPYCRTNNPDLYRIKNLIENLIEN